MLLRVRGNNYLNSSDDDEHSIPDDIMPFLNAYDHSDKEGKLIILSLLDHTKYTKQQIQTFFVCSKHYIDKARALKASEIGVTLPKNEKLKRNRMSREKFEHFLQFLFSSDILQDVAYGVTNLKFDDGTTQTVPHTVLKTKFSHAIKFYTDVCDATKFIPLSDSSMWRILKALKPSQRKSLAGLDDITAAGMNGFSFLEKFVHKIKAGRTLVDKLERGKRYLKTKFQSHCSPDSPIKSHNPVFALSLNHEAQCPEMSNEVCVDCHNLISCLDEIQTLVSTVANEADLYDVSISINNIIIYMKHQMRDYQQRQAKSYCFNRLDSKTALWIKDFAQKVLPQNYREGQKEYFGKKGMSLHIDVFFRMDGDDLQKHTYFTAIFRCKQGLVDVLNIGENVLGQYSTDCPDVKSLFLKSDNAGSYHGNHIMEATYKLCRKLGLALLRYDFNEPCKGKDQCDRESAGAKTVMSSYVNSGNNINTANDIHEALHYGKGIKNSKVCVLEINEETSKLKGIEIPNVSSYHSIEFFEEHMVLYRYFKIGSGVTLRYNDANTFVSSHNQTNAFSQTGEMGHTLSKEKKKRRDRELCKLLFCPVSTCTCSFENQSEYDAHLLSEKHIFPKRRSSMDFVRSSFVEKLKSTSHLHSEQTYLDVQTVDEAEFPLMKKISERGWALPLRQYFRYNYQQKKLLYDFFMEGERTGKKKSPDEVHLLIRSSLRVDDWVTPQQIRSLFSTFAKKLKEGSLEAPTEPRTVSSITISPVDTHVEQVEQVVVEEIQPEDPEEITNSCLQKELFEIMGELADWDVGEFVAIVQEDNWLPGKIVSTSDEGCEVKCMKYLERSRSNKFEWCDSDNISFFRKEDMLLRLDAPTESGTKRRKYLAFSEDDFSGACDLLRAVLKTR